jgi:hypothetical protein
MAALALAGLIADTVAAAQLLSDSGPVGLLVVWPIGGIGLLVVAGLQSRYVDRFARVPVLVWLSSVYAGLFALTLVLFTTSLPVSIPAGVAWLLADQMVFLLPLVVWSLAGDVFTAGEALSVYARIMRWTYAGQFVALAIAVTAPWWLVSLGIDLIWLMVLPPIACAVVAVVIPRALRDAPTSHGHGRSQSLRVSVRETTELIRSLPAFTWLLRSSFAVMLAGGLIEFASLQVLAERVGSAGSLQAIYAGASLAVIAASVVIQRFVTPRVLQTRGVAVALIALPVATVVGVVVLLVASALDSVFGSVVLAMIGLFAWRTIRGSLNEAARQSAMATLPDEGRARATFLVDLVPIALGFVLFAPVAVVAVLAGAAWLVPAVALVPAVVAVVTARRIVTTWEDTQFSYRLKRRRRL